MKPMLAAMPVDASLPPALQSWLGQELEMRGIDAVIYTRYILSILLQETADCDLCEDSPWAQPSPWKAKTWSRKVQRRKASSKDLEEMKKTAAVECLLSVTEEDTGIKNLIDELYSRLKEQSKFADLSDGSKCVSSEDELTASDSDALPGDPVERYYQAFPSLSGSDDDQNGDLSICGKCGSAWSEVVSKPQSTTKQTCNTEQDEQMYPQQTGNQEPRGCIHGIKCVQENASPEKTCRENCNSTRDKTDTSDTEKVSPNESAKQIQSFTNSLIGGNRIFSWPDLHPPQPCYFEMLKDLDDKMVEAGRFISVRAMVDGLRGHRHTLSLADLPDPSLDEEDLSWYTDPVESMFHASPRPSRRLYRRRSLQPELEEPCMFAEMMHSQAKEDEVFTSQTSEESNENSSDRAEKKECNNNLELHSVNVIGTDVKHAMEQFQLFQPEPNKSTRSQLAPQEAVCQDGNRHLSDSCLYVTSQSPEFVTFDMHSRADSADPINLDCPTAFYLGSPDLFHTSRPGSRAWFSTTNTPKFNDSYDDIKEFLGASSYFSLSSDDTLISDESCQNKELGVAASNILDVRSLATIAEYETKPDGSMTWRQQWLDKDDPLPYDAGSYFLPYNLCSGKNESSTGLFSHVNTECFLGCHGCNFGTFSMQNTTLFPTNSIWSSLRDLSSNLFQTPSPDLSILDAVRSHLSPHRDKLLTCHLWDVNMQCRCDSAERPNVSEQICNYLPSLSLTLQESHAGSQQDGKKFLQGGVYGGDMFSTAFDESWKEKLGLNSFGSGANQNCWAFDNVPQHKRLPRLPEPQQDDTNESRDDKVVNMVTHRELLPSENSAFQPSQPLPKLYQVKSEPCLMSEPLTPPEPNQTCRFVQVKYLYKSEPHILQQLGLTDEDPLHRQEQLSKMTFSHNTHFKPISIEGGNQDRQPSRPSKATSSVETDQLTRMQKSAAEASTVVMLTPTSAKNYQSYWITDRDKVLADSFVPKFRVEKAREKYAQTGDSLDLEEPPQECSSEPGEASPTVEELDKKSKDLECNLDQEESAWAFLDDVGSDVTPVITEGAIDPTVEWLFADIDKVRNATEDTYLSFHEDTGSDYESVVGDLDALNGAGNLSELWGKDTFKNSSIWSVEGHCNPIWSYAKDLIPWTQEADLSDGSNLGILPCLTWPGALNEWNAASQEKSDISCSYKGPDGWNESPVFLSEGEPVAGQVCFNLDEVVPGAAGGSAEDAVRGGLAGSIEDVVQGAEGILLDGDFAFDWAHLYDEVFQFDEDMAEYTSTQPEAGKVVTSPEPQTLVHQPHELPGLDYDPPELPTDKAMFSADLEEEWLRASEDAEQQWLQDFQAYDVHQPRSKRSMQKSGSSKKPCSFYMEGNCRRKDCRFAHDMSNITCRFWEHGECFKGIMCPFLHGYQGSSPQPCVVKNSGNDHTDKTGTDFKLNSSDFPELVKNTSDKAKIGNKVADDAEGKENQGLRKHAKDSSALRHHARKNKSRAKSLPTDIKTNRG